MKRTLSPLTRLTMTIMFLATILMVPDAICRIVDPLDRALLDAVQHGTPEQVERLLNRGANANAQDEQGVYAISLAAERPVTSRTNGSSVSGAWGPIEHRAGYAEIVRALIRHGAQIDAHNRRGWTPYGQALQMNEDILYPEFDKQSPYREKAFSGPW